MTVLINVYYTSKPVNEGTTASYRMLKYCDIGLRWEKWFVIPACPHSGGLAEESRESFFRFRTSRKNSGQARMTIKETL